MDQLSGLQPSLLAHQQEVLSQGGSSGRSTPSSDSAPGKLFVGGLSWQTTQARALCILYSRHFWDNSYMQDKTISRHKQFLVSCKCFKVSFVLVSLRLFAKRNFFGYHHRDKILMEENPGVTKCSLVQFMSSTSLPLQMCTGDLQPFSIVMHNFAHRCLFSMLISGFLLKHFQL